MFASLHTSSLALKGVEHRGGPGFFARVRNALELRRQRRHLATLDDALLADIGLSRAEALAEADRPVWDAPRHWIL